MADIIKLPTAMDEVKTELIYQDDSVVIGIGKNDEDEHILVVRMKDFSWYWNLENLAEVVS